MKTTLYIIRHGKTLWNEQKKVQGWKDIPLSKTGKNEAKQLSVLLTNVTFDAVYSSSLKRAYQTAEAITKNRTVSITTIDEFKEGGLGIFEGLTWDEIENHPLVKNREQVRNKFINRTGGGESIQDVYDRVVPVLKAIINNHPNQTIAVISHGLAIKTMLLYAKILKKETFESFQIPNAKPIMIDYHHKTNTFISINMPINVYKNTSNNYVQ